MEVKKVFFRTAPRVKYVPCSAGCIECELGICPASCKNNEYRPCPAADNELMPQSKEWALRADGNHEQANKLPVHHFPSLLTYSARRQEKAFFHGDL